MNMAGLNQLLADALTHSNSWLLGILGKSGTEKCLDTGADGTDVSLSDRVDCWTNTTIVRWMLNAVILLCLFQVGKIIWGAVGKKDSGGYSGGGGSFKEIGLKIGVLAVVTLLAAYPTALFDLIERIGNLAEQNVKADNSS